MLKRNVIMATMRDWIPTPASAKGRLVLAALDAFGRDGYAVVSVGRLASEAQTTTGPLYHHFESKLGLYSFVREDVERRVLDRLEGALAVGGDATGALVVAFDYVARAGFARMLSEPHPDGRADPVATLLTERLAGAPEPLGAMLAAAWRAALAASADGAADDEVRDALRSLRCSPSPSRSEGP
jgi:AcrR family transcriptional regulator